MRVVYYKLPTTPENIVVADDPDTFEESEVALLFTKEDVVQPARWKIFCEDGIMRGVWTEDKEDFSFFVEDHNNFWCIVGADGIDNALLMGQYIQRRLRELEEYYNRMED